MKHLLKISYLIILAAIVASVSTSCGNESELFEEPVMYQTRAMTRASIGGEGMANPTLIFTNEANNKQSYPVDLDTLGTAYTYFSWNKGSNARFPESIEIPYECQVNLKDESIYKVTNKTRIAGSQVVHMNSIVIAKYNIRITKNGKEIFAKEVQFECSEAASVDWE